MELAVCVEVRMLQDLSFTFYFPSIVFVRTHGKGLSWTHLVHFIHVISVEMPLNLTHI